MAIVLGRETTVAVDGQAVPGVRSVSIDVGSTEFDFTPFGSRQTATVNTGYTVSMTIETIDDAFFTTASNLLVAGTACNVVATGASFRAVVSSVSVSQPLDDVQSFTITLKKTYALL